MLLSFVHTDTNFNTITGTIFNPDTNTGTGLDIPYVLAYP